MGATAWFTSSCEMTSVEEPTQQQARGSISDADVTLFEVCRRLEYLPQRKEKRESLKVNTNDFPITAKGREGKRAFKFISLAPSLVILPLYVCIYTYITHTHTHKRSLLMCLSCFICV